MTDGTEAEVLMLDATDVKAHPTASSLNKGMLNPIDRRSRRGTTSKRPVACDRPVSRPAGTVTRE